MQHNGQFAYTLCQAPPPRAVLAKHGYFSAPPDINRTPLINITPNHLLLGIGSDRDRRYKNAIVYTVLPSRDTGLVSHLTLFPITLGQGEAIIGFQAYESSSLLVAVTMQVYQYSTMPEHS